MTDSQKTALKIGSIVIIFLAGLLTGTTFTKAPQKEIQRVEVEKNGEAWRELKAIDDEAVKLYVTDSQLCQAALYAVTTGDPDTIEAAGVKRQENNAQIETVSRARSRVLKALGY